MLTISVKVYTLTLVQLKLTLTKSHRDARKQKLLRELFHVFDGLLIEFGMLLRIVNLVNLILNLYRLTHAQGK